MRKGRGLVAIELLSLFVVYWLSIAFISICYNILCFIIAKLIQSNLSLQTPL